MTNSTGRGSFMRRSGFQILCAISLVCCSSAFAQNAPPRRGGPPPDAASPMARPGALTREQEDEIRNWAKERMPNLHKLMSDGNHPRFFFGIARMRFRSVKQSGPDTENLERLLKNIKNEDEVYFYLIELEKAKPEDKPALREKIRSGMREVFNDYLAQRAERIERLKDRLADEEKRLEDDRAQADSLVSQQLARLSLDLVPTTRETTDPAAPPAGDTLAAPVDKKL